MAGSSSSSSATSLLGMPPKNIADDFVLGEEEIDQGSGRRDPFFCCRDKVTGRALACKVIAKETHYFDPRSDRHAYIKNQVAILTLLRGLPNVVRLKRTYEDAKSAYLVMECCPVGSLAAVVSQMPEGVVESRGWQKQMQRLFADLASALHCCHLLGVSHNDFTVHNVRLLFDNHRKQLEIKIGDFGRSVFLGFSKEELGEFENKCKDSKNLGPILYFMLSGNLKTSEDLEGAALRGEFSSTAVKQCLPTCTTELARSMLKYILLTPIVSTTDILNRPWITRLTKQRQLPEFFQFLRRLMQVMKMEPHQRVLMAIIAMNLPKEELATYKKQLNRLCTADPRVYVSEKELGKKLRTLGLNLSDYYILSLLNPEAKPGRMVSRDFYLVVFSLIPDRVRVDEGNMQKAFAFIDSNNDKMITKGDLESTMMKIKQEGQIIQAMDDVEEFRMHFRCFKSMLMTRLN